MKSLGTGILTFLVILTGSARAELLNGIAVIVNDAIITYEEVQRDFEPQFPLLERRYRDNPQLLEQKMDEKQKEVTERLVERNLILHEFKTAGYVMPESVIDNIVQDEIREKFGDRITLTKTLQAQGRTFETWRQDLKNRIVESEMQRMNVDREILISPHKIENYYVHNRDRFKMGDQVRLRMISLNQSETGPASQARDLACQLLTKIRAGASFSEMASIYSEGSQKTQGGDYGWVEKSVLVRPLSDAAFALEAKQVTDVLGIIRNEDGVVTLFQYNEKGALKSVRKYSREGTLLAESTSAEGEAIPKEFYLLFVEDKRVSFIRPLAEVRDEIEQSLKAEESERLRRRWIERLRKKSFVRYF